MNEGDFFGNLYAIYVENYSNLKIKTVEKLITYRIPIHKFNFFAAEVENRKNTHQNAALGISSAYKKANHGK